VRLSKSYGSDAAGDANFGAAVAGPSPVPVLLLEQSPWVLGSTEQIKADGGDGRGDLRAESFEGPVFSGDRDGNLARCRSWAVGWRRPKAGDWGAERAHLAKAAKGGGRPRRTFGGIGRAAFGAVHRNGGGAGRIPERYGGGAISEKAAAALSKNCNYGWSFLERVGELLGKVGLAGKATFCGKVSFLGGCSVYELPFRRRNA